MKLLKNKILMTLTSGLMIMVFLVQSVLASEGLKFNKQTAEKLATELQYCKDSQADNQKIFDILNLKVDKYYTLSEEYKKKNGMLEQDKVDLRLRGDRFEEVYTTCTDDLNKCKQEKPSRLVWWSTGFLSAVVLGVVSAFAFRK